MTNPGPSLLKRRSELLDFLLEVSEVSAATLELDRLLPKLAGMIKQVIDYEILAILLVGEGDRMKIQYAIGHRESVIQNMRIRVGEGISGAAAAERRPMLVHDVRRDPRYLNALDVTRSELAVPMVARGQVVGVIDLQSTRLHAFTIEQQGIVELIASRVALAIDNARLYRRAVRQNRTLRTMAEIGREFSSILELDPLLKKVSVLTRKLIPHDAFSILLLEPVANVLKHYISVRYDRRVQLDNIPLGRGIVGAAAESRQPVLVPDTGQDPRYIALSEGILSEIAVPLIANNQVIGVLDLESERVNHFTEEHARTLSMLAPPLAIAIENARLYQRVAASEARMESDLEAARQLQQHLWPECCPPAEGLEVAARCQPARQIGGDLYDFSTFPDRHLGIHIGDVSGKGAAAALYSSLVTGLLRLLAQQHHSPAALLRAINRSLLERKIDANYISLLCAHWRPETRTLVLANSGMPLPVIASQGRVGEHQVGGIPLGLLPGTDYDEMVVTLAPGDLLVSCSDGIVDNRDRAGAEYGRERLIRLIERHRQLAASELLERIFQDAADHAAGAPPFDDQTAVVLKAS